MNFRRLKYFVKIVDIGSLTQAAEVLHIAQPALSQQVATLEGELNQQLLIRTKRGVTPTDAGKILYTHARAILRQCEQAQLAVHNVGQALSGQVSIGFAPGTAASSITMPLLQAVRAEFPEIVIYLHENSDVCVARESKRCSEASARSVTGGDSKWIAVQPQRPLLGRLCNKRGPGSLSA